MQSALRNLKATIQYPNQEEYDESLLINESTVNPIIFQVNLYTTTDTIRKRYKIIRSKGRKLGLFDYEEIEY